MNSDFNKFVQNFNNVITENNYSKNAVVILLHGRILKIGTKVAWKSEGHARAAFVRNYKWALCHERVYIQETETIRLNFECVEICDDKTFNEYLNKCLELGIIQFKSLV